MNNSYRVERYKKMKHQDIRDKIHLTYLSLVASEDASTINVRKLAEAAGIARSTFYIYLTILNNWLLILKMNSCINLKNYISNTSVVLLLHRSTLKPLNKLSAF